MAKKTKIAQIKTLTKTLTDRDVAILANLDNPSIVPAASPDISVIAQVSDGDFAAIVAGYSDEEKLNMAVKVGASFDERADYEKLKNANNARIQSKLTNGRAKLAMPSAAAILLAADVPNNFVNRSVAEGSRYNIYAVDKLSDLVKGLRDGSISNKVNIAICKSLFSFRSAGESFTGEMAKAATCDKLKVSAAMQKILIRHTVDPGTMSTQTSSTMSALQTLGIVENKGSNRAPVYQLTDTPQTKRLEQVLAA